MAAAGARITWAGSGNGSYLGCTLLSGSIPALGSADLTIMFWARIHGTAGSGPEGHRLLYWADSNNSGNWVQITALDANSASPFEENFQQIDFGTNPQIRTTGDNVAQATDWFYCLTWNHLTSTWTGYSVLDEGTLGSSTGVAVSLVTSPENIKFGCRADNDATGSDFTIRTIRAYAAELNSTEVDTERNSATPVRTTSLVADYQLGSASALTNSFGGTNAWPSLSQTIQGTGTITDGSMDPVDLQGGGAAPRRIFVVS